MNTETSAQQCPTCRAVRDGSRICRRCRSDLSLLLELEARAEAARQQARYCLSRGWYRRAATLLLEARRLHAQPQDIRHLACAQLLCGDFPGAWHSYLTARSEPRCG